MLPVEETLGPTLPNASALGLAGEWEEGASNSAGDARTTGHSNPRGTLQIVGCALPEIVALAVAALDRGFSGLFEGCRFEPVRESHARCSSSFINQHVAVNWQMQSPYIPRSSFSCLIRITKQSPKYAAGEPLYFQAFFRFALPKFGGRMVDRRLQNEHRPERNPAKYRDHLTKATALN